MASAADDLAARQGGSRTVMVGLFIGALAGAAGGAIEAVYSWDDLAQFLTLEGKLRLMLCLADSYGLAAAAIGLVLGLTISVLRNHTQLGDLVQGRLKAEHLTSARVSLAFVTLPIAGGVFAAAFLFAFKSLSWRKHPGLVLASAIAIGIVATIVSAIIALLAARPVERAGSRVRALRKPSASWWIAGVNGALGVAVSFALRDKLAGAPMTQVYVALGAAISLGLFAMYCVRRGARDHGPMSSLAAVLAGIPLVGGSIAVSYVVALRWLGELPHAGAQIAAAMLLAVATLSIAIAVLATVVHPLAALLAERPWSDRQRRALESGWAPVIAGTMLVVLGGGAAVVITWDTLSLLRLRPLWAALVVVGFALPSYKLATDTALFFRGHSAVSRAGICVFVLIFLFLASVWSGSPEGVRKASTSYSGLGEPISRALRILGDLDRDGYSRFLGGGDCNDWNSSINPGAGEIPGDGIDNNCVRGDLVVKRSIDELAWSDVPPSVPADFNVVLITIDTIRAARLAYGYERPTTPTLDKLAAEGALFESGWAHAPSTRYSIPAILTGRYPLNVDYLEISGQWPGLSDKNVTIAEVMKRQGFSTGAILNYWYFDELRKMTQGFDSYDNSNKRLHRGVPGKGPAETSGTSSREQTEKALAFVEAHAAKRFFLWVHYYDPHFGYERHEGVQDFGTTKSDLYDHEIRFTDDQIGRLIADLRARGLYEKTVFVVTGDHGEGFGEHGVDLHGYHLYAAQTKVPLILRVPGMAPTVVSMPGSHVDILPTLANLSGADPTDAMMGRSLVDVLGGAKGDPDRCVFQQLSYENNNEMRAAASARCHVIFNVSPNMSWELYRVESDPLESRDIIGQPGDCAGARDALEIWYDSSEIPNGAVEALVDEKPTPSTPTDVAFGDMLLLGIDMPSSVRRGDTFDVTYNYQARGTLSNDWRVFAHFESKEGGRFLGDHEPTRPFSWWRAEDFVRYTRTVRVPKNAKPGDYTLWMGIYHKDDRLPASSPLIEVVDNRAALGHVKVIR
jgi:arylsulfatase A-like enzyme